jgi:hypothetical protein
MGELLINIVLLLIVLTPDVEQCQTILELIRLNMVS